MTQELGFTNVSRLAGGIIAYDRTITDNKEEKPLFEGMNYVFDGRVGRKITEDKLGTCITCGVKTNRVTNCKNSACHKRMVQCEDCASTYLGTCSDACKQRIINSEVQPRTSSLNELNEKLDKSIQTINNVDDYCTAYSTEPPALYQEIEANTRKFSPEGAHMVSGATQGRLLSSLASMTRNGRILELGAFTGYATCCFIEGVSSAAKAMSSTKTGSRKDGPYVMSLERDQRAVNIAAAHIDTMSLFGIGDAAASHAEFIRESDCK